MSLKIAVRTTGNYSHKERWAVKGEEKKNIHFYFLAGPIGQKSGHDIAGVFMQG